jgi:hypothetical protein
MLQQKTKLPMLSTFLFRFMHPMHSYLLMLQMALHSHAFTPIFPPKMYQESQQNDVVN